MTTTEPNPTIIQFLSALWQERLNAMAEVATVDVTPPDPATIAASAAYKEWEQIVYRIGSPKTLEATCEKWGRLLFAPYRVKRYVVPEWFERTTLGQAWHTCRLFALTAQGIRLFSPVEVAEALGTNRAAVDYYIKRGELTVYTDITAHPRQGRRLMSEEEVRALKRKRLTRAKVRRTTVEKERIPNPQRLQRKRDKGWRNPPNSVYVGRPHKYSNPFTLEKWGRVGAVEKYKAWLLETFSREEIMRELRGYNLLCWCPLTDKEGKKVLCHADVLLAVANDMEEENP